MLHEDHLGNRGNLKSGAVQWMSAGRGIIHSEMPQQENGRMRGFQLWINLPAKEKMKPAGYRDIQPDEIPVVDFPGGRVKIVAGSYGATRGPIHGGTTEPSYWDVQLEPGKTFSASIPDTHAVYVYPFEGSVEIADRLLKTHQGGALGSGDAVAVKAGADGARFLVLAAKPIGEPIVQYGPFVMNTRAEIEQAIHDYQNGELTKAAPTVRERA
jgi:redox-sensitive bicupin YhaK (pirin superfamily)